jgi:DNA (cytosine-5)-methyltransferase 1
LPRLLDLFCGAGGAGWGYHLAGFDVVGVDIQPQPHYPLRFIRGNALREVCWSGCFDAIHASPPCQRYSKATAMRGDGAAARNHPDLIGPLRSLLRSTGLPWIIENVPQAPIRRDIHLCGFEVRRERYFEIWDPSQAPLVSPCSHELPSLFAYGHGQNAWHRRRWGEMSSSLAKAAMGVPWMNRDEMGESIPPAFTHFLGDWLRQVCEL